MILLEDSKSIARSAQHLVLEARKGYGSPPIYEPNWQPLWGAKVDRIEINADTSPSVATIWFPALRWDQPSGLSYGDMIRIRTDEYRSSRRTVLFIGFIAKFLHDFSGGTDQRGSAFERNAFVALDHRWLLATTSTIFGQLVRGPDNYTGYGTMSQSPIKGSSFWATGRRCIFNEGGRPNRDPELLTILDSKGTELCEIPIFADPQRAAYWTARDMIRYILSPVNNSCYDYLPIADPNNLAGLAHEDFDKILNNIVIDGLNTLDALRQICRHLGFSFRLDFSNNDSVNLVLYKLAAATSYKRNSLNPIILHRLYSPKVSESVAAGVQQGKRILWSATISEDIEPVINYPWGIGHPDRFEFTAELVPAWLDEDFIPDTTDGYAHLFYPESELQKMSDPNLYPFYGLYHRCGLCFIRDVGRKWSLNESGRYTLAPAWSEGRYYKPGDLRNNGVNIYRCLRYHFSDIFNQPPDSTYWYQTTGYDRGMPFDFSNVIDAEHILSDSGKRMFAPFNRQLLNALTVDKDSQNSIGIKVEFSFDGGLTWQTVKAALSNIEDECGLYIDEANLAEICDQNNSVISTGPLAGLPLNYFTSIADDKINNRSFKSGEWRTRIRVTASVQLDRRLARQSTASNAAGSPFHHSQLYDFSAKYGLKKRTTHSQFYASSLPAWNTDDSEWCDKHLGGIRRANEDASISASFTLERLWLGDGRGQPDFAVGDCIERIEGRNHSLAASFGKKFVYPEIIKIVYLPDRQKMQLVTRDLRFASEVVL